MTLFTDFTVLTLAALATWEIIEIWRHSSLFQNWRARVDIMQLDFVRELLMCPFCLSPWVAGLILWTLKLAELMQPGFWQSMITWPIAAFAVARLANLFNDVTHDFCRTPRYDKLDPADSTGNGDGDEE